MRPFKHVARTRHSGSDPRYQNVLGIDIARFRAPWGEVPVVATTERDRITVYCWNDSGRWDAFEHEHERLRVNGDTVEAPTRWNWSDRVAVACASDTVHVVYKRATFDGQTVNAAIVHARYQPRSDDHGSGNHGLELVGSTTLVVEGRGQEIGRSLWAACDEQDRLIVLYQRRLTTFPPVDEDWTLRLLVVDTPDGPSDPSGTRIGKGGFDLDARLSGGSLVAVYRETPEAFRMPLAFMLGGGRLVGSGAADDPFFEPLQLTMVDVATLDSRTESIAGGEHPQIQRTTPLLITFDRPNRLHLQLNPPVIPLPPARPVVHWSPRLTDTVAWLRDGAEIFRGVLLTTEDYLLPHSLDEMSDAVLLFEDRQGLLVHASAFRTLPVQVLRMERDTKLLTVDVLHHRDRRGLYRTRLRAALSDGAIQVADQSFEVWDIGHAQIGRPDTPGTDAENAQFESVARKRVTRAQRVVVPLVPDDGTMGGNLVADLSQEPVGFFAYTDLGDGGLRVIYAADMPRLEEPPPVQSDKVLRPDQVTGPHLSGDIWVEIEAADWVDSQLPGYSTGLLHTTRSLGSALEVPVDFLLNAAQIVSDAGETPDGEPIVPEDGMTREQLRAIDTYRAKQEPPLSLPVVATDGRAVTLQLEPGGLVAGVDHMLTAGGEPIAFATIAPLSPPDDVFGDPVEVPDGPLTPADFPGQPDVVTTVTGDPLVVRFPRGRRFRLSVFFPDTGGGSPGAFVDLEVSASTYESLLPVYDGVADGSVYRLGDVDMTLLQYAMRFGVSAVGDDPSTIAIQATDRAFDIRFAGGAGKQGHVEARLRIRLTSNELRFGNALDDALTVRSLDVTLGYGRPYTPGMLLRDQRSRGIFDGERLDEDAVHTIRRAVPATHAAIGAKPIGDASVEPLSVDIRMALPPGGIVLSFVVAALVVIGATTVLAVITGLVAAAVVAAAAGPLGVIALIVIVILLTVYITTVVPGLASDFAEEEIRRALRSADTLEDLSAQPILRYGGEAVAEAIARKALVKARDMGLTVPEPAGPLDDLLGVDRTRGQIFQMIFVSEGRCRVLLRLDD